MIPRPVALASAGCLSAIGTGMRETTQNLRKGISGVGPVTLFDPAGCRCTTAAEVGSVALRQAARSIHPPAGRWSRPAQMVLVAMAEALAGSPGFVPDAVIIGTTSGAMDLGEKFFSAVARRDVSGTASAVRRVAYYPPQMPVIQSLEVLGCPAPVRIVSNACASGTNALGMAWQLVRSGRARRVLAGGYDALSRLVFSGFDCLQASTPELCRPFDAGRSGLVLGEGAAMFCITQEGPVRLTGYGAATDTHHLTQPHPSGSGPLAAMRAAMGSAGSPHIDYINAHGTATTQNDACESLAIEAACLHAPVSSTKAATGHTLGAAGAIEAAFCMAALTDGFLPPTLNYRSPDPSHSLEIAANEARPAVLRSALSNSFGFGGSNASLILELP